MKVTVACSVSEEAHACHPHAAQISEDTAGQVSFAEVSQQLNVRDLCKLIATSTCISIVVFSYRMEMIIPVLGDNLKLNSQNTLGG